MRTVITNRGSAAPPPTPGPFEGSRRSEARDTVAEAAAAMPGAFTVEELVAAVRKDRPDTGQATVYRAVTAMEATGWLQRVGERDGNTLFARCGETCGGDGRHHHHLVCTGCGAVVATDCPVSNAIRLAADSAGFTITGHDLRLYGLCPDCAPAAGGGDGER